MSKHFHLDQFDCPCCGKNWTNPALLTDLDKVQDLHPHPIEILSGYRCKKHNAEVGGVAGSQHVEGQAADVTSLDLNDLYEVCSRVFTSIGDGRIHKFLHLDRRIGNHKWLYP